MAEEFHTSEIQLVSNVIDRSRLPSQDRSYGGLCYLGKAETASAAAKMGHAEIASRVAKSSASTANCHLLSCAR
jgi:hypothetical protein